MKSRGLVLAACLAMVVAGPALGEGCDLVLDAQLKGTSVPTHSTFTFTMNGLTVSFDSFAVNGKIYSLRKGVWKVEAEDTDEAKTRKYWAGQTCILQGSETIDGEVADIVFNSSNAGGISMEARFWISRTSGQILKTETLMPNSKLLSVYDYNNVQLPPEALLAAP